MSSLKNLMGVGMGAESSQLIVGVVFDGLTATGTTQADALQITGDVNVTSFVVAGSGVRLPPKPQPGDEVLISNFSANDLTVYPYPGSSINGGAIDAPFTLPAGQTVSVFARKGSQNWIALGSAPLNINNAPAPDRALKFNVASNSQYIAALGV